MRTDAATYLHANFRSLLHNIEVPVHRRILGCEVLDIYADRFSLGMRSPSEDAP